MPTDASLSLKDAIGLAADVMTLFGLSGFFTWSFVRNSLDSRNAADVGVSIFVLAVKAFISIFFLIFLAIPAVFLHIFVIMFISDGFSSSDGFWNDKKATAFVVSYFLNALWFIPTAVLSVSSIFAWSTEPFDRFWRAFIGFRGSSADGA